MKSDSQNALIINFNLAGILISLGMLTLSVWLTPIDLATKGFWAIGVLMMALSLVNFVKYRFDERLTNDRLQRLEDARNERLLSEYAYKDDV